MLNRLREGMLTFCKKLCARLLGRANQEEMRAVRRELEACLQREGRAASPFDLARLPDEERELYERIRAETAEHNRNNVTRTAAYLAFYERCPEIHWALLAHMVSRNGGYSMTDLKGDLLARALEPGEAGRFFQFLERANFLIFGDAYPQLLLYEAGKRAGKPLFHLLPGFGVSQFMGILWERFWEKSDSALLTMGLVVNEQNFIEQRVVRHPRYRAVMESFEFRTQTYLHLTQVIFPFLPNPPEGRKVELAGVTVGSFRSLSQRIDTGRRLYAVLFGKEDAARAIHKWAAANPHTGSRNDYWPDLFSAHRSGSSAERYEPRLENGRLRKGAAPLYSPRLTAAWEDVRDPEPAGGHDWCGSAEAAEELYTWRALRSGNITKEYAETLALVEKAVAAETWLDFADGDS